MSSIKLFRDLALNIGVGGPSDQRRWFKIKLNDILQHHENNGDIVWKELVVSLILSLRHSLNEKVVYIHTDSEACKCMLINMRAKLSRPDLQLIINETGKI